MKLETRNGKPYMSSCGKVMPMKPATTNERTSLQLEAIRELIARHKKSLTILEEYERYIIRNGT